MKNHRPAIAVIIPCYNDSSYVAEAIQSVKQQSFEDWECTVVDDGSTDDSLRFIQAAVSGDDRFAVAKHGENRGLSAARNTGISETTGRLVAFLDSDDLMTRRSLEDRFGALSGLDREYVAGSYSGVRFVTHDVRLADLASGYRTGPEETVDFITADGECPFPVHAPLTKRAAIEQVGGFNDIMRFGAEDWDLWLRILRSGYVFVPASLTSLVYRQRTSSMTREHARDHTREAARLLDRANSHFDVGSTAPGTARLTKPLGAYRAMIKTYERGVRFAAMAILDGNDDEAELIINDLDVSHKETILRHVDVAASVEGAYGRVHGPRYRTSVSDLDRTVKILNKMLRA